MADAAEAVPSPWPERRRTPEGAKQLASSAPDLNYMFFGVIGRLLKMAANGELHWGVRVAGMSMVGWLITLLLLFLVGVPAIQGMTIFWNARADSAAAEREFQLEMFKLQTDIELKKMDRTLLGDAASKTLGEISQKLDVQSEQLHAQTEQNTKTQLEVQRLSGDVQSFGKALAATDRRVNGIARQQARRELGPPPDS